MASLCGSRLVANPFDVNALFTKAMILAKLGNVEGAVEMLNGVLARNPNYPGGWRVLSKLYEMLGQSEKSQECISKSSLYVE